MEENKDDLITQGKSASDKITDKLFNDLMHQLARRLILDDVIDKVEKREETGSGMVKKINEGIDLLAARLKVNRGECAQFLESQLKRLGMLKTFVEFQIENNGAP